MNIVKRRLADIEGYSTGYRVWSLLSVKDWLKFFKYRRQRADRGFSDRDMWDGGHYIMRVISDSLKWYEKESLTDWDIHFKAHGTTESHGYTTLKQVYKDIDAYLNFTNTRSWNDNLELVSTGDPSVVDGEYQADSYMWVHAKTKRPVTEEQQNNRRKKHAEREEALYGKAKKALEFWAQNVRTFWD